MSQMLCACGVLTLKKHRALPGKLLFELRLSFFHFSPRVFRVLFIAFTFRLFLEMRLSLRNATQTYLGR